MQLRLHIHDFSSDPLNLYIFFYIQSSWLRRFESEIADYFQLADAIFIPSGVMAQSMVLKINEEYFNSIRRQSPNVVGGTMTFQDDINSGFEGKGSFLCHFSSHLLIHEQDSYDKLLNMNAITIGRNETSKEVNEFRDIQGPMTASEIIEKLESIPSESRNISTG